jgi:hypothetical protein
VSGGGKGGDVTVGYRYFLGMHMALCHGPIDKILEVQVDGRVAWTGTSTGGSITVDAPDLFGGDKREGGVSGVVDFEFGEPLQGANSYLTSVLPGENPAYRGVACAVLNQCYMGNNPYLKPWSFTAQRVFVSTDGVEQWNLESAGITKGAATATGVADYVYNLATDDPVLANHEAPFGLNNPDAEIKVRSNSSGAFQSYVWPTDNPSSSAVSSIAKTLDVGDCHPPIERIVRWNGNRVSDTLYLSAPPFNGSGALKIVYMGGNIDPGPGSMTLLRLPVRFSYTRANDPEVLTYQGIASIRLNNVSTPDGTKMELRLSAPTFDPQTGVTFDILLADFGLNGQAPYRLDEPYEMTAYIANSGPYSVFENRSPFLSFYRINIPFQYGVIIKNKNGETLLSTSGFTESRTSSGWFDYGEGGMVFGGYLPDANAYTSRFLVGGDRIDLLHLSGVAGYTPVTLFGDNPPSYFECGGDCPDMNPAHIIRECLTQPWGLGYQDADIDDTAFTAAATALLSEGMGMSILWDKEVPIEDFVSEILRHIDGVLYVSRTTGKFVLKLIRNDYDEASLITLDETNARMASDARRPAIGELVTSVTVEFTDVDQDEETGSVTLHNEALIQLQGAVNNATAQYPGFMTRSIASRVAQRDLKSLSTPLLSCDIEAGRVAADLNIGDAFKLDFPEQGIYDLVMRVESMSVGDGRDNTVKISCVEDAFSVPDFDTVGDTGPGWVDPVDGVPEESEPRLMIESPYYELVQRVGDREAGLILADDPDAGFLFANGGRQGSELNADLMVDGGSGYVDSGILDFAPYAILALDAWYSDSKLYYTSGKDLDTVTFPALAQVGEEIVRVDSLGVDSNGAFMSVGRGVLDTVPAEHLVDSAVVFFTPATDNVQYTASDSVNVKLLTALGSQRLADAPADTVTFDSRAIRPYPPGNLEIDLESYPRTLEWDGMHSLSWAHRDRLLQTSGTIFDYTEGDIGPEAGTTYRVTADAILTGGSISGDFIDVDVGSATDWEQDSNTDSNVGPPPEDADYVRFKVTSYRDGYESWQPAMVVIPMPEPIDSIGIDSAGFDSQPDSSPSDPYFANVSLLLHMDGADGSTTFTDSSSNALSPTVVDQAQIDTSQSKYGGASMELLSATDHIYYANSSQEVVDLTTDFTIEGWIRPANDSVSMAVFDSRPASGASKGILVYLEPSDDTIRAIIWDGLAVSSLSVTAPSSYTATNWHHVAVCRSGNDFYVSLAGAVNSGSITFAVDAGSEPFRIGRSGNSASSFRQFVGHIDDVRITKGIARYTAAFTPPTAPFPDE